MVAIVGFILLSVVSIFYAFVDVRIWGTKLTPGVVLITGYTLIAGIYAISSYFYDFIQIGMGTYLLLILFAFMSIAISVFIAYVTSWNKHIFEKNYVLHNNNFIRNLLLIVTTIYIFLSIPLVMSHGGLLSSESKEVFSHGIMGHLHTFLVFLLLYYAITTHNTIRQKSLMYILVIASLAINPTKGWTLIAILALVLISNTKQQKKSVKILPLILLGIFGIIFFFSIYLSRQLGDNYSTENLMNQIDWIMKHLIFYLTAGLCGLNAVVKGLNLHGGLEVLFAPFVNVYSVFSGGSYVPIISHVHIYGMVNGVEGSNVYSMIGSLIAHSGLYVGVFIALLLVGFVYFLFAFAWRLHSSSLKVASFYMTSMLGFGWFAYYFFLLTPYEIFLYAVLGYWIERLRFFYLIKSRLRVGQS